MKDVEKNKKAGKQGLDAWKNIGDSLYWNYHQVPGGHEVLDGSIDAKILRNKKSKLTATLDGLSENHRPYRTHVLPWTILFVIKR